MDVGNATIIAAAIAAAVSLGSSVFAWCAANKSNKAAAQSNEVTNRTNREIAVFEQDEENKRNESQIDANIVSVSYTHLDVYKRQVWKRSRVLERNMRASMHRTVRQNGRYQRNLALEDQYGRNLLYQLRQKRSSMTKKQ